MELMREETREPQQQGPRDDGHFADIPQSEREDTFLGFSTTYVTLNAVNGELPYFPKTKTQYPNSNTNTEGDQSRSQFNSDDTNEESATQTAHHPHRISSPPAFQNSASNPNTLSATAPNRLTQRHTLEVPPRLSTSRTSKETTRPGDEIYASGRFSPGPNTPTRRRNSVSLVRRVTRSAHSDLHLDEVPQSEDADRWADMIKQRRASKRRRKEDDDEDRVVMGTKVDQNHVNYVTAYNMLTGIRFTVSRTNAKLDRELVEADFDAKHKFSFDM
jgi:1-phosphatidylinositol-4-phosphate 5-kinase